MQAVLLAAGKGTRMGEKTADFPKTLLTYKDKTLIEWKLDALPETVDEVVIVIGYAGQKIRDFLGDTYKGRPLRFAEENEAKGTGYALWKTREMLKDRFLVLMGDDIYSPEALLAASKEPWSITVKAVQREDESSRILMNEA